METRPLARNKEQEEQKQAVEGHEMEAETIEEEVKRAGQGYFQDSFAFLSAVKAFHFQARYYSEHKASDAIYEEVNALMDEILESWQGVVGRISFDPVSFQLQVPARNHEMVASTDTYLRAISDYERLWTDFSFGDDLINLLQELKARLHKFKYLLSFV